MIVNSVSNNIHNIKNTLSFKQNKDFRQEDTSKPNEGKNDILPFAAAAVGVSAAVIAGLAIASGKSKIPPEVSSAIKASDELQSTANTVAKQILAFNEAVKEKFNSVCTLFQNKGTGASSGITVKIGAANKNDSIADTVMEEFASDGTLLRRSRFSSSIPVKIEEFTEGGKKNILEYDWLEGNYITYIEGYKKHADSVTIERQLEAGKDFIPKTYYENYHRQPNGTYTAGVQAEFGGNTHRNGGLREYFEDYSLGKNGDISLGKGLFFGYDGVNMYVCDNKITNGLETVGQELNFKDGKPVQLTLESKEIAEGEYVFGQRFTYDDKTEQWVESKS